MLNWFRDHDRNVYRSAVSTLARSFKEAQSYMGVLVLLPMLPGMISAVSTIGQEPWMYLVPVLGQHVLVMGVLGGRPEEWWAFVTAGLIAMLSAALRVRTMTTLFKIERIVLPQEEKTIHFKFPQPQPNGRVVMELHSVAKS